MGQMRHITDSVSSAYGDRRTLYKEGNSSVSVASMMKRSESVATNMYDKYCQAT